MAGHQEQCSQISVKEDATCWVRCVAVSIIVSCLVTQP